MQSFTDGGFALFARDILLALVGLSAGSAVSRHIVARDVLLHLADESLSFVESVAELLVLGTEILHFFGFAAVLGFADLGDLTAASAAGTGI